MGRLLRGRWIYSPACVPVCLLYACVYTCVCVFLSVGLCVNVNRCVAQSLHMHVVWVYLCVCVCVSMPCSVRLVGVCVRVCVSSVRARSCEWSCAVGVYVSVNTWEGLHIESLVPLVPLLFLLVSCEQFD